MASEIDSGLSILTLRSRTINSTVFYSLYTLCSQITPLEFSYSQLNTCKNPPTNLLASLRHRLANLIFSYSSIQMS